MYFTALLTAGFVVLVLGAELLVRGASRLARFAGISPLMIGLTIVAFGTSAPEFAVSVKSALADKADIAVGNVLGSNIFNVLFILGVAALIVPLKVKTRLVRIEAPLMILASGVVWLFAANGSISILESLALLILFVAYLLFMMLYVKKHPVESNANPNASRCQVYFSFPFIVLGLLLLVIGARWLVAGAA